ncbi:MarR family winged helix-turn-helix transcriptional regulator [Actibacterium ureilyticum]|uniref:MarR family winged helix-turn-helix transcriptional regulator n=1 Tax=Actibacterium ureilyticum TaxID=1590614 RepID=UPI000BAAE3DC|nr:MarR family transcriptional regulator [Actibacterium ureilyticum]
MASTANQQTPCPEETPSDAVLRSFLGYMLKRTYLTARPLALAGMTQFDLRVPSFSCLSLIVENPGIAPSVLAECLKMERSNIVVVIDELESRDLIIRQRSKTDRRRYELTATVLGRHVHDQSVEEVRRQEERLFAGMTEEERAQIFKLLSKIESSAPD